MHRCGLLIHMSHVHVCVSLSLSVCLSVCLCVGHTGVHGKGHFWRYMWFRDTGPLYAWVHSALFVCRCWRMCLLSALSGRINSPPRGVTRLRCGLLYLRRYTWMDRGRKKPLLQLMVSPCQLALMQTKYQICSEWLQRTVSLSPSRTTVVFGGAARSAQPTAEQTDKQTNKHTHTCRWWLDRMN